MDQNDLAAERPLPYLTEGLAGVGGVIKRYDDDFIVDEQPLYEASGEGTHTYVRIEKHGLTTHAAIRQLADALGKRVQDIGFAGLKDAHGVTRQTFSIEHVEPDLIESLSLKRMSIQSIRQHTNKLKLGHLAGNRFVIRIRDTISSPMDRARAIFDVLQQRGLPNYFGPQRFGVRGDNAQIGRAVLLDDYRTAIEIMLGRPSAWDNAQSRKARELFDANELKQAAEAWPRGLASQARICRALIKSDGDHRTAWRAVDHSLRKLYVSAVTSDLFNRVLQRRLPDFDRLLDGDLAWKHRNGACFAVEDAATEQGRCDEFEISPTGPIFGRKMTQPKGAPAEMESDVLEAADLAPNQIRAKDGRRLDGARRPLRVPLAGAALESGRDDRGPFLELSFFLPPGAYATNVTRELCKNDEAGLAN